MKRFSYCVYTYCTYKRVRRAFRWGSNLFRSFRPMRVGITKHLDGQKSWGISDQSIPFCCRDGIDKRLIKTAIEIFFDMYELINSALSLCIIVIGFRQKKIRLVLGFLWRILQYCELNPTFFTTALRGYTFRFFLNFACRCLSDSMNIQYCAFLLPWTSKIVLRSEKNILKQYLCTT